MKIVCAILLASVVYNIVSRLADISTINHYNQMIRTCELTLQDGQKCVLLAVPYIGETK